MSRFVLSVRFVLGVFAGGGGLLVVSLGSTPFSSVVVVEESSRTLVECPMFCGWWNIVGAGGGHGTAVVTVVPLVAVIRVVVVVVVVVRAGIPAEMQLQIFCHVKI